MNKLHDGAVRPQIGRALFPWRAAMSFGFGVLRLSSRDFWAMTPRELALAMNARRGGVIAAPDRATLNEMMRRFPDGVSSLSPFAGRGSG